ncbi:hypothetical protein Btru_034175 [Bulinus truncatus]|nr:hypothetical protein Btru_034175 [Bulinus truncatus]
MTSRRFYCLHGNEDDTVSMTSRGYDKAMANKGYESMANRGYYYIHDLLNQLQETKERLQQSVADTEILKQANASLHSECGRLQESINMFQDKLNIVCVIDSESQKLRQQLSCKDTAMQNEIVNHQMLIDDLRKHYDNEREEALKHLSTEFEEELAKVNRQLKEEKDAKIMLQTQLEISEKERKKDITRITLELESKLAEARRQNVQLLQQQHHGFNQGLIRSKMQHMKENYESEISSLKKHILELKTIIESLEQSKKSLQEETFSKLHVVDYQSVLNSPNSENRKSLFRNKRRQKKI